MSDPDSSDASAALPIPASVRLTLLVRENGVTLIEAEPLTMQALPSEPVEGPFTGSFGLEVQRSGEAPSYRRRLRSFTPYMEVPTGDPDRPLSWSRSQRQEQVLDVVVPAEIGAGYQVTILQGAASRTGDESRSAEQAAASVRELARFDIDEAVGHEHR